MSTCQKANSEATKVHKVELLIIDHDNVGATEIKSIFENIHYPGRCISPDVMEITTREIDWPDDDDHPLNFSDTRDAEFKRLFASPP